MFLSSAPHARTKLPKHSLIESASWVLSEMLAAMQYKDRVKPELIKPAVDWRKTGIKDASASAAVARA